jgi:hypothetical protein
MERYHDADPASGARRVAFWAAAFPLDPDDVPDTGEINTADDAGNNEGTSTTGHRADRP